MDTMQATLPEAAALTSKSRVSVFGMLRNLWAIFVQALEHQIDTALADADAVAKSIQIGTVTWYADQARAFQYGDPLIIINNRPAYGVVDPAKRIVTQVAVVESSNSVLTIKLAKPDGNFTQKLTTAEFAAFDGYIQKVKYAGVKINLVSLPPDELKVVASARIDRQVINGDGTLLSNSGRKPVEEALQVFGRQLPFNSIVNETDLTDFLQRAPGVIDFNVKQLFIRPAGSTAWNEFTWNTASAAGHLKVLEFQITYL